MKCVFVILMQISFFFKMTSNVLLLCVLAIYDYCFVISDTLGIMRWLNANPLITFQVSRQIVVENIMQFLKSFCFDEHSSKPQFPARNKNIFVDLNSNSSFGEEKIQTQYDHLTVPRNLCKKIRKIGFVHH